MPFKRVVILFIPLVIAGIIIVSMLQLIDTPEDISQTEIPVNTKTISSIPAFSKNETFTPEPTSNPQEIILASSTPTSANTPIPSITETSTPIPWKSFRMIYSLYWGYFPGASKLWIPIPNELNGVGMRNVNIESIQPESNDLYQDIHGNLIAFWGDSFRHYQTYSFTFTVDLSPININIHPEAIQINDPFWGLTQQEYELYTQANVFIPSDDERFVKLAQEIVGSETNPYFQAKRIQEYVQNFFRQGEPCHIVGTDPYPYSIVGAYELQCGACGEYNGLFITLLRTLGVPARYIGGHYFPHSDHREFPGGKTRDDNLGFHVWAEIYLPPYGWIQMDATGNGFEGMRLVLFRGEAIELNHGYPFGHIPYFHYPYVNVNVGGGWPESHTFGENISLLVEELP